MFDSPGDIFLLASIAGAVLFMLVLGFVSIEEAMRARKTDRP